MKKRKSSMGSHNLNEEALKPLFAKKCKLKRDSLRYIKVRNEIAKRVISNLGPELNNIPYLRGTGEHRDPDETRSLVNLALLRAIDLYEPSRGKCKFSSFLWTIIWQRLSINTTYWKAGKRNINRVMSLDNPKSLAHDFEKSPEYSFHDRIANKDLEVMEGKVTAEFLYNKLTTRRTDLRQRMLDLMANEYSQGKISEMLNVPLNIVRKEIRLLRKEASELLKP